jgi:hypothetical protein
VQLELGGWGFRGWYYSCRLGLGLGWVRVRVGIKVGLELGLGVKCA